MERIRHLEGLVKLLRDQLEQAHAASKSPASVSQADPTEQPIVDHQESPSRICKVQNQLGRLVLQDSQRSRYVGTGFWSQVNDEVMLRLRMVEMMG